MKTLALMFTILLVLLQYRLWFGNGSLTEVRELRAARQALIEENRKLRERNQSLAAEVLDLKQGHAAIEERARSELGMIRADETFYQIISRQDLERLQQDQPAWQPGATGP
jgi:cell division protein FtsB